MSEAQNKFREEVQKEFADLVLRVMGLGKARILGSKISAEDCANILVEEAERFAKTSKKAKELIFKGGTNAKV